jgi:predicted glycoside hydrolase/deacetylase ChbG (UPF0249 family)
VIKRLIINADDFGFSRSVTDGILHAHRAGILTSTTLMATMPDCDRALEMAQSNPSLGVGIHLCLTQGSPRSGKLRYLVSGDNRFPRKIWQLLRRIELNRGALDEAKAEWAAQIEYALKHAITPTHLDSHKHIHHWPALSRIATDLARQYHIARIRSADEINVRGTPRLSAGYRALRLLARKLKSRCAQSEVRTTDWFFGLAATGKFSAAVWHHLLAQLPAGTGEVMVHPGYFADLDTGSTRLTTQRQLELDALCDSAVIAAVGQYAADAKIQRIHFGQL